MVTVPTIGAVRPPVEPPVCPLLGLAGDPATHFTFPTAGHRCQATGRPAPIELAQQGALCLSATYPDCHLFRQAVDAGRVSVPGAEPWLLVAPDPDAGPRVTTASLAGRIGLESGFRPGGSGRRRIGAIPRVLVVVAVIALVAALAWRFAGSASSGPELTTGASSAASPTVSQSVAASASGSAAPSSPPSGTPSPSPITTNRTHVVLPGETLSSIAARYGVTLKAIELANHITDPNLIHAGERLIIPPP